MAKREGCLTSFDQIPPDVSEADLRVPIIAERRLLVRRKLTAYMTAAAVTVSGGAGLAGYTLELSSAAISTATTTEPATTGADRLPFPSAGLSPNDSNTVGSLNPPAISSNATVESPNSIPGNTSNSARTSVATTVTN